MLPDMSGLDVLHRLREQIPGLPLLLLTAKDSVEDRIAGLRRGDIPFYEPGLDLLVNKNVTDGRLFFTTSLADAMRDADVVFIAVQTPMSDSGEADLTYVMQVGAEIGALLTDYKLIVTKSTVPVGTARRLAAVIGESLTQPVFFDLASNPAFLREGSSIEDFMHPDRVVIGAETERSEALMREIYRPLFLLDTPIVICGIETAELVKYASNSFLAVKISFINEIANICEELGADVTEVAKGMGYDERIGPHFLYAGLGYGGSCFPKDVKALAHMAEEKGKHPQLLYAVMEINNDRRPMAVNRVVEMLDGDVKGKVIGLLGLAFKPSTDDMRDAPSIDIAKALLAAGAEVRGYDPVSMDVAAPLLSEIKMYNDPYSMAEGCDALMVNTEWNEFKQLDLQRIKGLLRNPVVIDGRNIYEPFDMAQLGFTYLAMGRGYNDGKPMNG